MIVNGVRIIACLLTLGILVTVGPSTQEKKTARNGPAAAKVGAEVIYLQEVVETQRIRIERERYSLLRQKLEELIAERLLAQEAKSRGMSVEQLLNEEVYSKAQSVTEDEITKFISTRQTQPSQADQTELRMKSRDFIRSQKLVRQQQDYVRRLREKASVAVYLEEPASARAGLSPLKGFARGPNNAPVTIVEFSDFQCPFCKAVRPTINELMTRYTGKVRWEFRDFPIQNIHPGASKAHEAARCAGEQGKFWEYHDKLFARSPNHSLPELQLFARDLKLESVAFAECLESSKYHAAVAGDILEGKRLGVQGTPTFFINGRMREGEQSLAAFQELIESELRAKGK
jgi:protein-disulfide isomerase